MDTLQYDKKNTQLPSGITPKQIKHDLRASSIGHTSISQIKQELGNNKTNKQKKNYLVKYLSKIN